MVESDPTIKSIGSFAKGAITTLKQGPFKFLPDLGVKQGPFKFLSDLGVNKNQEKKVSLSFVRSLQGVLHE